MTVHFILDTFQRKSFTLACKRIFYNHTYDNIALVIHHILLEFNIDVSKVTHVITDNTSNFGKTFRCFGVKFENNDQNRFMLELEKNKEDTLNNMDDDDESDSDIEINEFNKISPNVKNTVHENDNFLMDELGNEIILPSQLTCFSHTLNLIATTDCKKILNDSCNTTLKKMYRSAFGKLSSFWNIISRSTVASDICFKQCNCKFPVPVTTRWNSQYDAVKKLLSHKINLISFSKH